jgi:DNA repair protein RadC
MEKKHIYRDEDNSSIKTWVVEERPRELLLHNGAELLSLAKLLAIILRTGSRGISAEELSRKLLNLSAEELSRKLLNRFSTLRSIDARPLSEICRIKGIGPAKAAQIKAAFELGKRLCRESVRNAESIESPKSAIKYVSSIYGPYLRDAEKEFFNIILLNRKNKPIKNKELSKGSVSAAFVNPAEVIREAILHNASALILVHNHPSGDCNPSEEDIQITNRIRNAGMLFNIILLDHIIVGKNRKDYFSFRRNDLIQSDNSR